MARLICPAEGTPRKRTYLGIELGSTRIKSVLMDEQYRIVASGG